MPIIADLEVKLTILEGDPAVFIDADVTVTDAEEDYDGATLVIAGLQPDDVLNFVSTGSGPGQVQFDSATGRLYFEGMEVGTVAPTSDGVSVTFNADATNAAIEAILESAIFQNASDDPVYARTISITLTDAAGNVSADGVALIPANGPNNPFAAFSFDGTTQVAFGDIDNDGDLDVIAAVYDDGFHLLRNEGSASAPDFQDDDASLSITGAVNNAASVQLVDVSGDGFLDLIVGRYGGAIQQFNGDGTGAFVEQTGASNLFNGVTVYSAARLDIADLNGDGFLDIVAGTGGVRIQYFTGGASGFTEQTGAANPLDAFRNYGGGTTIDLVDIDGDGDFDLITGAGEGATGVFENTGDANNPVFSEWTSSVYRTGFQLGFQPVLVDIDNDGDLDKIEGRGNGTIDVSLLAPASPSIDVFVDGVDDPTTVNDDSFGGSAGGDLTGNLLDNDSDLDDDLQVWQAEVDGTPIVIEEATEIDEGVFLTVNYDGSFSLDLRGGAARDLGGAGSGASNTGLSYSILYTTSTGSTGTATITVSGVDDKDRLQGTGGVDTILAGLGNDIVQGLAGDDNLSGQDGNDALFGGADGDRLEGGIGADKLYGEAGDDTLVGEDGADYLYGDAGVDSLNGGDANDYLDGGLGGDSLSGGAGNDVYIIDDSGDLVIEQLNAGYDIVRSFVDTTLQANFEGLQLQEGAALMGTGNGLANTIVGNSNGNYLSGLGGVDTIDGGDGNDTIVGGAGNDILRGGAGADSFVVGLESISLSTLEVDQVQDFSVTDGDIIDLRSIDTDVVTPGDQAFTYAGSAFTKTAGEMILIVSGGQTTLRLDLNGDGKADYQMKINGDVTASVEDWLL